MTSSSTDGYADDAKAEQVFEDYLARVSSGEAVDFDALCDVHQEIASTLRDMKHLFSAVGETSGATQENGPAPQQIGPYHLRETLGEGGMGTVYLAEQLEPVRRRVALKIIKLGMDSKAIIQRFEQERQALALMDHDGIARVYDCGTTERGQPYFVMELVKGVPIDEFCEQHRLSLQDRLELIQQVCVAVQHAHQKGVVHRDLKPGNVLVTNDTGGHQIKIIDFGLAKAMGGKLIQQSLVSEVGLIIGTSAYMAPEQASPSNLDIDTRADIYSVGVLLYQVLVGELPFSGEELQKAGLAGMQRILQEVSPPKPSTKLTTVGPAADQVAARRRVSLSALRKALKTDLDWVVLKALDKDRNRRYSSANALAEDLQRFLDHKPLVAGPPSAFYQMQKLLGRYRGQFVAALLFVVTLLAGGISSFVLWQQAKQRAQDNARLAADNLTLAENNALIAEQKSQLAEQKSQLAEQNLALANSERLAKEQAESSAAAARREEQSAKASAATARAVTEFVQQALVNADPNQGGKQGFLVADAMDQAIAHLDSGQRELDPKAKAQLLRTISRILNGNARSAQALELAQQSLVIEREQQEVVPRDVAACLSQIGQCLTELDRYHKALPYYEEALAIRRQVFPGDHQSLTRSLQNLAFCLHGMRRSAEALPHYEAALAMNKRMFSDDHADTASNLNNLASCLRSLNRTEDALEMYQESLAMTKRLFPQDRPDVARSLNNVATCLSDLNREEEALRHHEESLAMMRRLFSGDHPHVATCIRNLATSLSSLERNEEALPRYEEALAMWQRLFPDDHRGVAYSLSDLAACLLLLHRYERALPRFEEALAMMQRLTSGDHPKIAVLLNNSGNCLLHLERGEEARRQFQQSLAMRRRLYPGDNPSVLSGLGNLALCLSRLGTNKEALPHAVEADAMAQRLFAEHHPSRKHTAEILAEVREAVNSDK